MGQAQVVGTDKNGLVMIRVVEVGIPRWVILRLPFDINNLSNSTRSILNLRLSLSLNYHLNTSRRPSNNSNNIINSLRPCRILHLLALHPV